MTRLELSHVFYIPQRTYLFKSCKYYESLFARCCNSLISISKILTVTTMVFLVVKKI
jgi:hypothetical protein